MGTFQKLKKKCSVRRFFLPMIPQCFVCVCVCISCLVVSDSLQPHRLQPSRPLCPWDAPGKNTRVGCHFPLQKHLQKESEVAQPCLTLFDPMDWSLPGSSIRGIFPGKSGLPYPSPGDLPGPEIEPRSCTLQADTLLSEPPQSYKDIC